MPTLREDERAVQEDIEQRLEGDLDSTNDSSSLGGLDLHRDSLAEHL